MGKYIQSPFNYTGGKYRLLDQIMPFIPAGINCFVDLFCGGGSVGINVPAKRHIYNDIDKNLIKLYRYFYETKEEEIIEQIISVIRRYGLSESRKYGYKYFDCNSINGLSKFNRPFYLKLRDDFNTLKDTDDLYEVFLYVLIVFSFNNQIRYNKEKKFNLPVGKRDFNKNIERKVRLFTRKLKKQKAVFCAGDFRSLDIEKFEKDSFFYCDPPYLITCATYNTGWTGSDDHDLFKFLDNLHRKGIRFLLSNIFTGKGKINKGLIKWAKKYNVHHLDNHYAYSSYHTIRDEKTTDEVLICNYEVTHG